MSQKDFVINALNRAFEIASIQRNEFVTPEHIIYAITEHVPFREVCQKMDYDIDEISTCLADEIYKYEHVSDDIEYMLERSYQAEYIMQNCIDFYAEEDSVQADLCVPGLVFAAISLTNSMVSNLLNSVVSDTTLFLSELSKSYKWAEMNNSFEVKRNRDFAHDNHFEHDEDEDFYDSDFDDMNNNTDEKTEDEWKKFTVCLNDNIKNYNPLIGREKELERTIQVLCRKDKNNPLHIGEPGVGKTSIVRGLAALIEGGKVPERLRNYRIYQIDLAGMLAGTQYRGEFEKRIKMVMDGMMKDGKAIAYIDEIHNLVGAGASNDGSMDASNILKPYLEENSIRFIGSTTFDEYKRYFAKSKGMIRRFQDIEIAEPSTDECVKIINGLKNKYEKYHNVKYGKGVIEYAVDMSARFINNRFLPDKAIDLIDEAGAFLEMHPLEEKKQQTVTKQHIADILSKVCKVESMAIKKEEDKGIKDLEQNIKQKIYGQDKAVEQVVEAIQMSKAGLVDENKPIASFLFVGPTGVGKTELCKVLAEQMGIQLVRFDMSEYTEKHTVAKLIGAPAGYIGYEDGGLLTDAIRKSPNCVLLLDEIEKAHSDIYNILLQVMDYARLTDNKGQKADFRHVVLVMTSNAGAQFASQASIGYFPSASSGESMMKQVKKTFKPEFLNRLNGIAVFNDMDLTMAGMILDKKIGELQTRLSAKNVTLSISDEAREMLLKKGFTKEYGAREMDRVIHKNLATQLAKKILFGSLKKGGNANATVSNGEIIIE